MNFSTVSGKKIMLTVDEPRANLTEQEVQTTMQEIINANAFEMNGSPLAASGSARIIERNVTKVFNA